MITKEEVKLYCRDLPPGDVERAIKFNEVARDEAIYTYKMFLEQKKLPRKIFIEGYNAMYAAAALFLAKKYKIKLDELRGSTHKNMRLVLDFYTSDSKNHQQLMDLYGEAIEKFQTLSQQYRTEAHFADKIVKDLMDEGFYQGKKINYYAELDNVRKDTLQLTVQEAEKFIKEIVKLFLFIIGELTND